MFYIEDLEVNRYFVFPAAMLLLAGPVPEALGDLSMLSELHLSKNKLTGDRGPKRAVGSRLPPTSRQRSIMISGYDLVVSPNFTWNSSIHVPSVPK